MNILKKIKNNKIVQSCVWIFRKKIYKIRSNIIEKGRKKRSQGKKDAKFNKIKSLKNSYKDRRCFVIATGPSLTITDLEKLNNEITFSMNSICKLFSQTEWRPTFYGIQDSLVFSKMKNDILNYKNDFKNIFIPKGLLCKELKNDNVVVFPFNPFYHMYDMKNDVYYSLFSDNSYEIVYDGYTITYSLIQIAIYLGFSEIYLLGVDCDYSSEKKHVVESGYIDKNAHKNNEKMITSYKELKKYIENENRVRVINCTRGGKLDLFPRKTIEEVLIYDKD